jgi:PAS domain S-box-containing protein
MQMDDLSESVPQAKGFGDTFLFERELFSDLSELLATEILRKKQEEELYLLFQSAPDILAVASPNGHFSKVNKAFCEILGYTEKELTTKPFSYFIHPDDIDRTSKEYSDTISGERRAYNFANRYRTKQGTYRWIAWDYSSVFGEEGQAFAYGRDITERKAFEESLKNLYKILDQRARELTISNAELEQFAYVASHDLQEPLRMVSSFLTQLSKKYDTVLDDKARQYIDFAVAGARRMRQIILDLLDYSRVNRDTGEKEEINLKEIVSECSAIYRSKLEEKKG